MELSGTERNLNASRGTKTTFKILAHLDMWVADGTHHAPRTTLAIASYVVGAYNQGIADYLATA